LGIHFLQEEGPEIHRGNERGTGVHMQRMSGVLVQHQLAVLGEEEEEQG